ncbi:right-handed parallel beta-helix repeat-containing protein [Streptomyces albipurpureus]|uniref:Right-handed parallel beta-helix repeat-containing protein n=1 Tax=Streptomyces albipurpureus TaxID=2897419 RepID=A0ABT0UHY6_9ACTN|nr:right-handed parallel beta-helix repeat-containing protein [Streptomyces sp. CWNU-1]MCM2388264.1 right-handed parallel beta-helix repeat-containing protein [Streptomyces sp. CWNU-1]
MIRFSRTLSSGWFAAVGATALISVSMPAQTAHAAHLSCGQTVTTSVVLDADLLNCPGDGLVVGSSGITIDLNGHTVDGVGLGAGIRNNGFGDVVVTNSGTSAYVQEFDHGVQLNPGTSGNIVEKLTVRHNEFSGIELNNADSNNRVRNNLIDRQSQRGVTIAGGSSGNVLADNTISANQGEGVFVQNSADNRLEANQITGSGDAGLVLEGSSGNTLLTNTVGTSGDAAIILQLGSNDNLVQSNSSAQNADAGLTVSGSTGNRILSNTLQGSGDSGIALQSSHGSTITGNDVSGNPGGIELSDSDNNLIQSNSANDTTGDGISLAQSLNNHLELNQANRNSSRGIYVVGDAAPGAGNRLVRNTANANQGDGIAVSKAVHTIQGNTARGNDSWGIFADPGNVDGGANLASDNAKPGQCTGVVCTP